MSKSDYYPYKSVTATEGNNITAIIKLLEGVGARDITIAHERPAAGFTLGPNPYIVGQNMDWFCEKNGGDKKKARRQAWSALRDYLKALTIRLQTDDKTEAVKMLASHLQLPGPIVETVGDMVHAKARSGDIKLLCEREVRS